MQDKSFTLTDRQLCDCEMILNQSFSPLDRFMNKDDYLTVLNDMRLSTGELFPIPITLDVDVEFSDQVIFGE